MYIVYGYYIVIVRMVISRQRIYYIVTVARRIYVFNGSECFPHTQTEGFGGQKLTVSILPQVCKYEVLREGKESFSSAFQQGPCKLHCHDRKPIKISDSALTRRMTMSIIYDIL